METRKTSFNNRSRFAKRPSKNSFNSKRDGGNFEASAASPRRESSFRDVSGAPKREFKPREYTPREYKPNENREGSSTSSSNRFGERRSGGYQGGRREGGYQGGGRSRFGGNRGGRGSSSGRSRFSGTKINHERYIKKNVVAEIEQVAYVPINTFKDFPFSDMLKENILARNYDLPTAIQDQTIPAIIEGKDVMALAATGSGKTAAFLLPLIDKVLKDKTQQVIIITPTRELAHQIEDEFRKFSVKTGLRSVSIIGGASMLKQNQVLRSRPQFVIATPGRLKDLANRGSIRLQYFNNVVLDEVDRMLDMGFVNDIKEIISQLSYQKQTLFFSATMNKDAEVIANTILNEPVKIEVAARKVSDNIEQDIVRFTSQDEKHSLLIDLLKQQSFSKVIIFSKTKFGADRLAKKLVQNGFKADALHGNKSQSKRNIVINKFRKDEINILVATDVAARGLDIPDVSHVINFDEPATYEDYIHRIGRTGRANKKGVALTFVS